MVKLEQSQLKGQSAPLKASSVKTPGWKPGWKIWLWFCPTVVLTHLNITNECVMGRGVGLGGMLCMCLSVAGNSSCCFLLAGESDGKDLSLSRST